MVNSPFNEDYHKSPYPKNPDKWQVTPPAKPKPLTIMDVFPRLDHWAIGFDEMFATLNDISKATKTSTYPPYNIAKFGDDKFEVRIAVAGFKKNEIDITVQERTLKVSSNAKKKTKDGEFLHQGIAEREFTLNFALGEFVEVTDANLEDGMLTIKLETQLPEEKKPKTIAIK
jgi:molecular chaperone IbpA